MTQLIIYRGSDTITLPSTSTTCYIYQIGSGQIKGEGLINLNDSRRLNQLAEEIRDDYSIWVYSLNELFLESGLTTDKLSLFFLTDLSCKRAEFFDTFDCVCNLLLIREKLRGVELTNARLIGVESQFALAFRSMFPATILEIEKRTQPKIRPVRRLVSDILYLFRVVAVVIVNTLIHANGVSKRYAPRTFFSIYPQMFSKEGIETKYGDYPDTDDNFAVSILTDGMHQKTSIVNYVVWCRAAESKGYKVIDRYLALSDVSSGLYWAGKLWRFFINKNDQVYEFKNIDISGLIKTELLFSISRVMRLCVLKGALRRFLESHRTNELLYYPCEYPLGRMVSWISSSLESTLLRTGFQMSIASNRRLEQFLAPGEASTKAPFLKQAPIPDRVLAEDATAASIYRYSGYKNVEVMDKIYRYAYLEGVNLQKNRSSHLIAPGLHDGAIILEHLRKEIATNTAINYLVKPHPRADNTYLTQWSEIENLIISTQSIGALLSLVSHVYVTYSSVGVEASRLGLDVTVINIPGRVNTSPLANVRD